MEAPCRLLDFYRFDQPLVQPLALKVLPGTGDIGQDQLTHGGGAVIGLLKLRKIRTRAQQRLIDQHRISRR